MVCSLAGSSVHGVFQARVLEWGAIAFSRLECRVYLTLTPAKMQRAEEGEALRNICNAALSFLFQHNGLFVYTYSWRAAIHGVTKSQTRLSD